jgi:hypothetical protein
MEDRMDEKKGRAPRPRPAGHSKGESSITPDKLVDEIRARAYELHRARGNGNGSAMDDWLAAEREIKAKYKIAG